MSYAGQADLRPPTSDLRLTDLRKVPQNKNLRRLLWLYFLLVIFEGALRKWVFPGLATPLLLVRDPVCIAAIVLGFGHLQRQPWVWGFVGIGIVAIPLAILFGHGSLEVAFYGARILLLHFPVLFLFPAVFDRDDVWRFAKVTLLIAIPMTVLLAFQFYAPPSHPLNIGVGGQGTSVFSGAAGRFRCSGTFSFTNGVADFYGLAGALFMGWFLQKERKAPLWFWLSGFCLIFALPLSISRTIAFYYALTGVFALIASVFQPKILRRLLPAAFVFTLLFAGTSQTTVFQDAMEAFSVRWERATATEGEGEGVSGVIKNRVIDYRIGSVFGVVDNAPLLGLGIGIGTQAGAQLATGERGFLIAEGEMGRIVGELGPLLGFSVLGLRLGLALVLAIYALAAVRRGIALPWIMGGTVFVSLIMGGTGQPTSLGFLVVGAGLLASALNDPETESVENDQKVS